MYVLYTKVNNDHTDNLTLHIPNKLPTGHTTSATFFQALKNSFITET